MNKKLLILGIVLLFSSCIVKKKTTHSKSKTVTVASSEEKEDTEIPKETTLTNSTADNVIASAIAYSGARYKYGGTTKKGMDCSGLIYVALQENDIAFPRVSYDMANEGKRVRVNEVQKGDLLFFKTQKKSKRINHVGMVVAVENDEIKFIHSSSSRGVIVSSLREGYWNAAFIKATRIL